MKKTINKSSTPSNPAKIKKQILKKSSKAGSKSIGIKDIGLQISETKMQKTIHEYKIHLTELELQNQELRHTLAETEVANKKYNELYDDAPSGYCTLSKEGIIIELNFCCSQMLGKERSLLLNSSFSSFITEDTIQSFNLFHEKIFNVKSKEFCEVAFARDGGLPMSVHLTGNLTEKIDQYFITMVDITERKRAEEALMESVEKKRYILEKSNEGIVIGDHFGIISTWNKAIESITGIEQSDALGKYLWDIQYRLAPPEFKSQEFADKQKNLLLNIFNRKINWQRQTFEQKILCLDGTIKIVENSSFTIDTKNGLLWVSMLHDISERKITEELLKESENRYERIATGLTDYFYTVKVKEGKAVGTYHSEACLAVTGYSAEEFASDPYLWINMVVPEEREWVAGRFLKILDGKDLPQFEHRIICKDGTIRWISDTSIPKYDSKGSLISYDGVIKDITGRKVAEEALKQSEENLLITLNSIGDGVISTDIMGNILRMNPIAEKLCGWNFEDAKGKPLSDVFKIIDAVTRESRENQVKLIMQGQKIIDLANHTILISKDGSEYKIADSAAPIKNVNGDVFGIVMVFSDITEEYEIQNQLKTSEKFLKETQKVARLGIYSLDIVKGYWESSEILDQIFGIEENFDKSVLGWASIIHPEWQQIMIDYFTNEVVGNKKRFDKEYQIIRQSNQEERWVHGLGELIFNDENMPINMIGTIQDITDRKTAELIIQKQNNLLQELNSSKDKLFSIISHDLRGPFQSLIGFTGLMVENILDFSSVELLAFSKEMHMTVSNISKLLKNLLEWSQMQRGKMNFAPQNYSLHDIAETEVYLVSQSASVKEISIINTIPDSITVNADEKMINSVFLNLLSNGVKFTIRGGEIIIGAKETENNMVEISVSDTGIGMPEELITKLFKIEVKVKRKGTDGEDGTGLGLLLCKEFIEKHGGKIWVESYEGEGTTFYFTLHKGV